ncbi:hypothetical protein Tco_0672170 [Tanacetum coccineum]
MSTPTFATTHNLVAFLEKLAESNGFEQIIDFLNASHVKYALTVNHMVYSSCIKQFWDTVKVKIVNGQDPLQALVDKQKVIITEESIRNDLHFADKEGTDCLPNDTIFEELARMGYEKPSQRFVQLFFNKQVEGLNKHKETFVASSHTKKIFANMRRQAHGFSGDVTPLFETMMVQATEEVDEGSNYPLDQPSTSTRPQKTQKPKRKQRKVIESPQHESDNEEHVPTFSNDPLPSGEDSFDINEFMVFCLSLQEQVLDLKKAKDAQKIDVTKSKSSKVTDSLGDQEDSSKQGRRIEAIDADDGVTLEAQNEDDADLMFDTLVFDRDEVVVEHAKEPEVVTTVSGPTTTTDELTLAQTLIDIAKSKKVKAISTAATLVNTAAETRPKAKGIVFHEIEQTHRPTISSQPSSKDKGKAIMIEPKKPLKRKEQVVADKEYARQLAAEMEAKLKKEERERRQKEDEANLALIELWEAKKAMMEADRLLAERLQAREREELSIKEKSKLFIEIMNKRNKHFAELRAQEMRNKPPTKSYKRNQMSTYLKNIGTWKHSQLKSKSYEEIERLFEIEMKRMNTFIPMNQEEESSKKDKAKSKFKRAVPENEDDVTVDATPLSSRSPSIVDYKIHKEGKKKHFQIIRADGNSKYYLTFGQMFKNFNRDDVEDLWKIVKSRFLKKDPVDDMDNLLLRTLNTMFKPQVEDTIWTYQQGLTKVKNWKLYDSCGVYCVIMQNIVYYLLVEKTYPLTRNTLHQLWNDVRLQVDYEVEMAYELLRLIRKQLQEGYVAQ